MRALVVSNMLPDAVHPERGRFVRDQVQALRAIDGLEVELFEFAPGAGALRRAPADQRRSFGPSSGTPALDLVHAHFGLSGWPALAVPARVRALTLHGTDLQHPRTRLATRAVLPLMDLVAAVSCSLVRALPGRAARRRAKVLPCGVDLERFRPIARAQARAELGLDQRRAYLLFPADPARAEKRHDRALELARASQAELLTLGGVAPERVPLWLNAANAAIVPSEREGFGLAVLEALACDIPVLATPVGIHAEALEGLAGTLCAPFDLARWRAALQPHLRDGALAEAGEPDAAAAEPDAAAAEPDAAAMEDGAGRIHGRSRAMGYSAASMAERVAAAWRAALERAG